MSRASRRLAALLAAVLIVGALGGCGEKDEPAAEPGAAPAAPGNGEESAGLRLDPPAGSYATLTVRRAAEVAIRTSPGGGSVAKVVDRRTEYGSPAVFGVLREAGGWAGVTTPHLANGRLGWVRLDPRKLRAGWTSAAIEVDLSERTGILSDQGNLVRRFPVTVGAPGAETPTGRFAVTDSFRGDLNPAYGCCALALTARQPSVPSGWLGGNRIAIHATSGPLGVAASHGCIRAANDAVYELVDRVPLGSPVFIRN